MTITSVDYSCLDQNEDFAAIQDLVAQITGRYDRQYYLRCVAEDRYPVELLNALGEADLLGFGLPEQWGGVGGGLLEEVAVVEALGRAGIPAFSLIIGQLARIPIVEHGSGDAARRYVDATLRGDKRPCFAITEPDAGTNAFAMRTTAKRDGDGWRVTGQKTYISGASDAEQMLLVARTEGNGRASLILLIVDMTSEGLSLQNQPIDIIAPCKQATVFLDNVYVPNDCVVGEPGQGTKYLFESLNHERIMVAAMGIGVGAHVLAKGVEYAKLRAPFGTPIGSYQSIQHPLARSSVRLESGRLMTYEAAVAYATGRDAASLAAMAKWISSEAAWEAMDAVVQAHGGYAFDEAADLMRFQGFIRSLRVAPINNEMLLNYLGQNVLRLPKSY